MSPKPKPVTSKRFRASCSKDDKGELICVLVRKKKAKKKKGLKVSLSAVKKMKDLDERRRMRFVLQNKIDEAKAKAAKTKTQFDDKIVRQLALLLRELRGPATRGPATPGVSRTGPRQPSAAEVRRLGAERRAARTARPDDPFSQTPRRSQPLIRRIPSTSDRPIPVAPEPFPQTTSLMERFNRLFEPIQPPRPRFREEEHFIPPPQPPVPSIPAIPRQVIGGPDTPIIRQPTTRQPPRSPPTPSLPAPVPVVVQPLIHPTVTQPQPASQIVRVPAVQPQTAQVQQPTRPPPPARPPPPPPLPLTLPPPPPAQLPVPPIAEPTVSELDPTLPVGIDKASVIRDPETEKFITRGLSVTRTLNTLKKPDIPRFDIGKKSMSDVQNQINLLNDDINYHLDSLSYITLTRPKVSREDKKILTKKRAEVNARIRSSENKKDILKEALKQGQEQEQMNPPPPAIAEAQRPTEEEEERKHNFPPEPTQPPPPPPIVGSGMNSDGLWDDQLESALKSLPHFKGVISLDELHKIPAAPKVSLIMNLDTSDKPGSHWVAVNIDAVGDKEINYFDPFGTPPPEMFMKDLKDLVKRINPKTFLKLKINNVVNQDERSNSCGPIAAQFLIDRSRGKSFKEATGFKECPQKDNSKQGEAKADKFRAQNGFGYI